MIASALAAAVPGACTVATPTSLDDGGAASDASATGPVETVSCPSLGEERYLSFTLAAGVDGIEFRAVPQADVPSVGKIAPLGTPCGKSTHAEFCAAQVAATTSTVGWKKGYSVDYGVVTRGDDVSLVTTLDAFVKLVTPISDPKAAVALAQLTGLPVYVCDPSNVQKVPGGFRVRGRARGGCGAPSTDIYYLVGTDGSVTEDGRVLVDPADGGLGPCMVDGRRPMGFVHSNTPWLASLAAHFAEAASMESAAVIAFDQIIEGLKAFDAPASLVARAEAAREDEVRHAKATTRLARRFGGEPRTPEVATLNPPSLYEFALDNAVEGCVRETYGALVAAYQGAHAEDFAVRRVFAEIAHEELQHAELSWDIASWVESKLTMQEQERISDARRHAIGDLMHYAVDPSEEVRVRAGMPTAATIQGLVNAITPELLAAA